MTKKGNLRTLLLLHILIVIYSASGIFSKLAGGYPFLSVGFILCYGMVLVVLGVYAIVWQQIIKKLPLMTAYANKAVTVVWGMVWGTFIFREKITPGKMIGAVVVILGVIIYVSGDAKEDNNSSPEESLTEQEGDL